MRMHLAPLAIAVSVAFIHCGCLPALAQSELPRPPSAPPTGPVLEFTGPDQGWPPHPKGMRNLRPVRSRPLPGTLTDDFKARVRTAALRDPRVRNALGERFTYIKTRKVEPPKGTVTGVRAPTETAAVFYSYSNNTAVVVRLTEFRVERIEERRGYQPPEGEEEVEAAVALARRDSRLRSVVRRLEGVAIRVLPRPEAPSAVNRVLYVVFRQDWNSPPRYYATVDMTDGVVVAAGPLVPE